MRSKSGPNGPDSTYAFSVVVAMLKASAFHCEVLAAIASLGLPDAWLAKARPGPVWQVKNQAAVHLWYPTRFGVAVEPLADIADAVATFPETATAVAARHSDELAVLAPLGLDDLLDGVWRYNPARCTPAEARRRVAAKDPARRWPGVRVMPPSG